MARKAHMEGRMRGRNRLPPSASPAPGTPAESPAASPVSGAELRSAPRFALLIRAAKLIVDGREYLCILRDASATGVKIRLFTPIPKHSRLAIELGNGDRHDARLVWTTHDHAGLQFLEEVDVQRLINERGGAHPRRQVRLRVVLDAVLHAGGESTHVRFHDISQQGACIECEKWLAMNELVRLDTGVMPSLYAKVRWRDHPRYGLVFEQTFKLDELARISAPLQLSQALTEAARQSGQAPGAPPQSASSQPPSPQPAASQNGPSQTGRGRDTPLL
jgi:hypothetical protein